MDPLSLTLAIAPLVVTSTKVIAALRSVKHSYQNARTQSEHIERECELVSVALCEVQGLVFRNKPERSAIHAKSLKCLEGTFDKVLTGCRMTLDALQLEIDGVLKSDKEKSVTMAAGPNGATDLKFKVKARFVWNERTMKDLMEQIKDQKDSIHFLISILQSDTQVEILKLVRENTESVQKLLNRARSIRSLQGVDDTESTFHAVQSFIQDPSSDSFEQELKQSSAYQKARSAAAEELLTGKLELLEEKYKLEETLDQLHIEVDLKDDSIRLLEAQVAEQKWLRDTEDKKTTALQTIVSGQASEIQQLRSEAQIAEQKWLKQSQRPFYEVLEDRIARLRHQVALQDETSQHGPGIISSKTQSIKILEAQIAEQKRLKGIEASSVEFVELLKDRIAGLLAQVSHLDKNSARLRAQVSRQTSEIQELRQQIDADKTLQSDADEPLQSGLSKSYGFENSLGWT